MESKNYAEENIPAPLGLIEQVVAKYKNYNLKPQYSFYNLFNKVDLNGNTEYHRNNELWGKDIPFNTWNNKVWEEEQKQETDQRKKNEVKGLYIFFENGEPIYVGISRTILRRLKNHFLGKTHNTASLVYLILRDKHDREKGLFLGERAELSLFNSEREPKQEEMRSKWSISIIPMEDNYEMYLTEFYLACHLKTKWNSFETH